ncbi:mucin-22-like [Haliotis rufescens]|uniref:mucin-22-like n=1 Tax=Haliotis rufescens TaxID=6454 RepID=UPI00201F00CA|nr:mucin-22-like [Haliotis rufescens]
MMQSFNLLVFVGISAAFLSFTSAHSAYDSCTSASDCPATTTCRCNGDNGYQCLCDPGYVVGKEGHECVIASRLGEACNASTKCVNTLTYCNSASGVCECLAYHRLSANEDACVFQGTLANGEACDTTAVCFDVLGECKSNLCGCRDGFRLKNEAEFWAEPESIVGCVADSFVLENPVLCPVTTTESTTTTPTTSATSTATSTTSDTTTDSTTQTASSTTDTTATTATTETTDTTATTETTDTTATTETTDTTATTPTTTTVQTTITVKVFDVCTGDAECPGDSSCSVRGCAGSVCMCNTGFVATRDRTACFQGKLINDACDDTSQCVPFLSYCDGTCKCSSYVRKTNRMTCAIKGFWVIGEACGHVSDCLDPNALCTRDGVCQCKTGYRTKTDKEFWDNPYDRTDCVKVDFSLEECVTSTTTQTPTTTIARDKKISEICAVSDQCPLNSACEKVRCGQPVCRCQPSFRANSDNTACVAASKVGEACTKSTECTDTKSSCAGGVCICLPWTVRSTTGCVYWFQRTVGQYCGLRGPCADPNAECSRSAGCVCRTGYHLKTDPEFWLDPTDTNECAVDVTSQGCPTDAAGRNVGDAAFAKPVFLPPQPFVMDPFTSATSPLTFSSVTLTFLLTVTLLACLD